MNSTPRTIVVVGGVAGGASAAARARRCNEDARIILFEKDEFISFANCGLPYHIGGEIADRAKLFVTGPDVFDNRFNVEVYTCHEVTAIDRNAKNVLVRDLDTGEELRQEYDRLILAPGASPVLPPLDGVDAPNVFTLRNIQDMDRIKAYLEGVPKGKAVVVGAGFIGLEMVEQLHGLGMQVALVELAPQVLPPVDPEMAAPVERALVDKGVEICLGNGLKAFESEADLVRRVELDDGVRIDADIVILAMGVRPNNQLARGAGLECGATGGIKVNRFMQTDDPHIYAVGDVIEYRHGVLGADMSVPLAGPANRAGRLAGEHAATDYARAAIPVLGTAILRVFDKTAAVTGLSAKAAHQFEIEARAVVIADANHAGYYPGAKTILLKLVYEATTGKVLGAQAVGGAGVDKRIDVIATAIHFGGTVYDLAGLDLAYAPPFGSAKDPVHLAAFAACNDLDGLTTFAQADDDFAGKQVLDVRTEKEFARMHLPGSVLIPIDTFRACIGKLDPQRPTVVVCHSGWRAHVAARILRQRGFNDVSVLTGGILMRQYARPEEIIRTN